MGGHIAVAPIKSDIGTIVPKVKIIQETDEKHFLYIEILYYFQKTEE